MGDTKKQKIELVGGDPSGETLRTHACSLSDRDFYSFFWNNTCSILEEILIEFCDEFSESFKTNNYEPLKRMLRLRILSSEVLSCYYSAIETCRRDVSFLNDNDYSQELKENMQRFRGLN